MEYARMERTALPATLPAKDSQFAEEILRRIRAVSIPSSGGQWFTTEGIGWLRFIWSCVSHGGSAGKSPCPGFTGAEDGKPQPGLYPCCSQHQSLLQNSPGASKRSLQEGPDVKTTT